MNAGVPGATRYEHRAHLHVALVRDGRLAEERNHQGLVRLNTEVLRHEAARPTTRRVTLDFDSSESPVYGAQEQAAYNGHFESVCYHPLFVFNQHGDCLAAKLRPGNVHSADGGTRSRRPSLIGIAGTGRRS